MNKAAFLTIVRQVAPIQDQEVEDLEKLVVSFPYCQTAHVLLAKAAYDRGSMLSTQKLRRAAAHVSNRQLLKQLVYSQPPIPETVAVEVAEAEPAMPLAPVSEQFSEKEAKNEYSPVDVEGAKVPVSFLPGEELVSESSETKQLYEEEPDVVADSETEEISIVFDPEVAPETSILHALSSLNSDETEGDAAPIFEEVKETNEPPAAFGYPSDTVDPEILTEATTEPEAAELPIEPISEVEPAQELQQEAFSSEKRFEAEPGPSSEDELLNLIQISSLDSFTAPSPKVNLTHDEIISEILATSAAATVETVPLPEPEVNVNQFSQDISSSSLEVSLISAGNDEELYVFPMLKASAGLPQETPSTGVSPDPYLEIFTQNNLAYWLASSRLGESLQMKDDFTSPKPFYFHPELILEHVRENSNGPTLPNFEAPTARLDQQLDIINQFLKLTPKLKTLANAQQKNEPQEDLSAKSSKIKKNLASENLALIYQKQGKTKKAIKIYEQLIVKFPEKKSYFAHQIEKLRNEL
ncbi:MAG: hypothetical protein ACO1OQ_01275 [Rufibacter sp.]